MERHNQYDDKINKAANTTEKTSENAFEILQETSIQQIQNIASILFNTKDGLCNAAYYTGLPKECSDGSNLYTIIKLKGKDILIKVGAGEFNTEVFNQENINKHNKYNKDQFKDYKYIKGFSKTPIPLFVVDQSNSHFASENQKFNMENNPTQYLENNSTTVIPKKKQAYIKGNKKINFNDINILQSDIAIKKLQTAIFESKFSNKELTDIKNYISQRQAKDLNKFENTIKYLKEHSQDNKTITNLIYLLENIVEIKRDIQQMYTLINIYNTKKNKFE